MNRAFFDEIYVDIDGVTAVKLTEPFAALLAEDLISTLDQEMKNRDADTRPGSRMSRLVEVMGLEPTTSTLRT